MTSLVPSAAEMLAIDVAPALLNRVQPHQVRGNRQRGCDLALENDNAPRTAGMAAALDPMSLFGLIAVIHLSRNHDKLVPLVPRPVQIGEAAQRLRSLQPAPDSAGAVCREESALEAKTDNQPAGNPCKPAKVHAASWLHVQARLWLDHTRVQERSSPCAPASARSDHGESGFRINSGV